MDDLEVRDRRERDHTVVAARGEIDVRTAGLLRERLTHLIAAGRHHVVVDLRQVTFMDSTGLGVLVGGLKLIRTRGGTLELVIDQQRFLRIFTVTGLDNVFVIHADLDQLGAVDGGRPAAPAVRAAQGWLVPAGRPAVG